MGDLPGTIDLAQPDRQAQARRAVLSELLLRAAAQQRGRECDSVAGGHVELGDLKSAVSLLLPNRRTVAICLSIRRQSRATETGGEDIEHHHIVSMVRDYAADIFLARTGGGPVLDRATNGESCRLLIPVVMKPLLWVSQDSTRSGDLTSRAKNDSRFRAEDRLAEFVATGRGQRRSELANGSELERALALLITKRRVHVGPLLPSDSTPAIEWPFFCPPPPCHRVSAYLQVTGFCAIYSKPSEGFVHS